jgi:hypothetical protein
MTRYPEHSRSFYPTGEAVSMVMDKRLTARRAGLEAIISHIYSN